MLSVGCHSAMMVWVLLSMMATGLALPTSELGREAAHRHAQTLNSAKQLAVTAEANSQTTKQGMRRVLEELQRESNAQLRTHLHSKKQAKENLRRSQHSDCENFELEALNAYLDSYSEACGLDQFDTLYTTVVFDLLLRSYPQYAGYAPLKPAEQSWNDYLSPYCSYTGPETATSCGAAGFYAKIRDIAVEYAPLINNTCQWQIATLSETPKEVLDQIVEVWDLCSYDIPSEEYCAPSYWGTLGSFLAVDEAEDPNQFVDEFIPLYCTDCVQKVFNEKSARAKDGSSQATALSTSLLCSQALGEWCYSVLDRITSAATVQEEASIWCEDLCMPIIAAKWGEIDSLNGEPLAMHKKVLRATYCNYHSLKDTGTYCYEVMNINVSSGRARALEEIEAHCQDPPSCGVGTGYGTGDCSADISADWSNLPLQSGPAENACEDHNDGDLCNDAFDDLIAWGCCADTFMNLATEYRDAEEIDSGDDKNGNCWWCAPTYSDRALEYQHWFTKVDKGKHEWKCGKDSSDEIGVSPCSTGNWNVNALLTIPNLDHNIYLADPFVWHFWYAYELELATGIGWWFTISGIFDGGPTPQGGTILDVTVPCSNWAERTLVIQHFDAISFENFDAGTQQTSNAQRRSAGSGKEYFLLTMSSQRGSTRVDPQTLVYASTSNVSVVDVPYMPRWGSSMFGNFSACNETRTWREMIHLKKQKAAITGGLGRMTQAGRHEVWICLKGHPCTDAVGSAFTEHLAAPFPGGVVLPQNSTDLMCYVYDEEGQRFRPWGFNSQLQLVSRSKLSEMGV